MIKKKIIEEMILHAEECMAKGELFDVGKFGMKNKTCNICGSVVVFPHYIKKSDKQKEYIEICGCSDKYPDTENNKSIVYAALRLAKFYLKESNNDNIS